MNLTDKFLSRICHIIEKPIPETVKQRAVYCLLDYIGCTVAGSKVNKDKTIAFINNLSSSDKDCTVLGCNIKTNLFNAVLANGFNSHIFELDDGNRFGMMHVGAPIFSALIAVCEKENVHKDNIVKAIVAGYEAAVLSSKIMQPSHKKRGYHTTGTCGTIGAAVACSVAMGLSEQKIKTAIDCAVTSAAGVLEIQENSSELKPYNVARAALDGVSAAYTSKSGYVGPDDSLGGKRGLFKVLSDEFNENLLDVFTDKYEIENVYFKIFASCRHCHSPIEAVLNIKKEHNVDYKQIEKIQIFTYNLAIFGHDHTFVANENSAKMSIPYSVAAAAVTGSCSIDKYTKEYIENNDINSLMKKIEVVEDKELTSLCPKIRAARAVVTLKNNESFESRVDYSKGEPENPISYDELKQKFIDLILFGGFDKDYVEKIIRTLEDF